MNFKTGIWYTVFLIACIFIQSAIAHEKTGSFNYHEIINYYHPTIPDKRRSNLIKQVRSVAHQYRFEPMVIMSQIAQESSFHNVVGDEKQEFSSCGYMQVKPPTAYSVTGRWRTCNQLVLRWKENIKIGARYLFELKRKKGSLRKALSRYNGGNPSYADDVLSRQRWFKAEFSVSEEVTQKAGQRSWDFRRHLRRIVSSPARNQPFLHQGYFYVFDR